jgi:hypothetical protein
LKSFADSLDQMLDDERLCGSDAFDSLETSPGQPQSSVSSDSEMNGESIA